MQDLDTPPEMQRAFFVQKTVWAKTGPWRNEDSLPRGRAWVDGKVFGGRVHMGTVCISTIQIARLAGVLENNTLYFATIGAFFWDNLFVNITHSYCENK